MNDIVSSKRGLEGRVWAVVSLPLRVQVPTQHGIFALALVAGALLGVLLAGEGHLSPQALLPGWLPTALRSALVAGGAVGATLGGLLAWLLCRPRRAHRWTIDYPRTRMVGLRGVTQ